MHQNRFFIAPLMLLVGFTTAACGDDSSGSGGAGGGSSTTTSSSGGAGGGSTTTSTSSAGGAGGTGGTGGGGGASSSAEPECEVDADCYLSNDCCECAGRPNGEAAPACAELCIQDACQAFELPLDAEPLCRAGRCVAPTDCDQSVVLCDQIPPVCPAGAQPVVDESNGCWQGGCQVAIECRSVTDCSACDGVADTVCVTHQAQLSEAYCVDVAAPCDDASCECLGPSVCTGSFDLCSEEMGAITCECPTC
jgi:hypothetical protein